MLKEELYENFFMVVMIYIKKFIPNYVYDKKFFIVNNFDEYGTHINKWSFDDIPEPSIDELLKIDYNEILLAKKNDMDKINIDYLKDNKLYKLLQVFCEKLGLDENEILELYKNKF